MGIKCGIVGLPNVGKSTLFNALTAAEIPAENYPFCTIDPNVGVVSVPDPRLDELASIVHPEKVIPATTPIVVPSGSHRSGKTLEERLGPIGITVCAVLLCILAWLVSSRLF